MGSKLILLLGLILGAILAFVCVTENKDALLSKYQHLMEDNSKPQAIVQTTEEVTPKLKPPSIPEPEPIAESIPEPEPVVAEPVPEPTVQLIEPSFAYTIAKNAVLSANFSPDDRNQILEQFILDYCQNDVCTQDITFEDNIKVASWQSDALKIATFLKDKNITNGFISVNSRLFTLKGELRSDKDIEELNKLIEPFSPEIFRVENLTTVAPKIIIEEEKELAVAKVIKQTQDEINTLLLANPIYFKTGSSAITKQSKITLNKILSELNNVDDNITLKVEGHTDARGSAKLNKSLSQKRANSVKSYLLLKSTKSIDIEAVGHGEEMPISDNRNDKINRRVEILLMKGM